MPETYKLVIVGGGGVGKSAITVRFVIGNFSEKYDPTIEESYKKELEIEGRECVLDIMDTAGQEEFSALRDSYMRNGNGFVLMYSITSSVSFETAKNLKNKIYRIREDLFDSIPIVLVGNKVDCESDRQVSKAEGLSYAQSIGAGFVETSAKENLNVELIFHNLVSLVNTWREKYSPNKKKKSFCSLL